MSDTISNADILARLTATIESRKGADPSSSYTAKLLSKGVKKIAQKVGEESVETAIAATSEDDAALLGESADLLYHLMVLLAIRDLNIDDVLAVLGEREGISGIDEKESRNR